jgi:cell pole-organizing protein PopZ
MAETAEQEPTMEEILASIRRIISEDDEPAEEPKAAEPAKPTPAPAPAPAPAPPPKPVLAEKPKPKPAPPPPPPEPEPVEEEVLELTERVDEPVDDISFDEPVSATADDGYVSTPVADAAAMAFGQLVGQMLVSSRGTEGKTLEDIVRELLKPMLRAWLDANLRQIVEARVAEEVERIAARGRR